MTDAMIEQTTALARVATQLPGASQPHLGNLPSWLIWPADQKAMVLVPYGIFVLGTDAVSRGQEQPAHVVTLPDFYLDRTPVTVAEYARFVGATGHRPPRTWRHNQPRAYEADLPVTGVSWYDACAYAAWAGKRLPSEAEWEKAASWDWITGAKRRYPWGDAWDARRCNMLDTGIERLTPVGAFSPYGDAPCGAADMAGNCFEWTASIAWNYPCQPGDGRDDPQRYGIRVRRGGAHTSSELFMRTTTRLLSGPDGRFATDGFRCAVDVAAPRDNHGALDLLCKEAVRMAVQSNGKRLGR